MKPPWLPTGSGEPLAPLSDLAPSAARLVDDLFRREQPDLVRYVARAQGEEGAQDIVQRVFARIVSMGGEHLRGITRPRGYLRTAARNTVRDEVRDRRRQGQVFEPDADDFAQACHDPVAMLEARDRLARIDAALLKLKPLTRQIFLARRHDGYSYAEIAERTGLSIKGVEKQMSRAIHQLGRHLHPDA